MLGDGLGCYTVFTGEGIFAKWGVRKLVSDDQEVLAKGLSQFQRCH